MTSNQQSGLAEARLALDMLKRGEYLNADHPLVVLEDALDGLVEQLEATERQRDGAELMLSDTREQLEALRKAVEGLKGMETVTVGNFETTRIISYPVLNRKIDAILGSNPASEPEAS